MNAATTARPAKARTGIEGLDDVLAGGFSDGHVFLIEGNPGTGKTTIALSFLIQGAKDGERGLYATLSETEAELRDGAASRARTIGHARFRPLSAYAHELARPEILAACRGASAARRAPRPRGRREASRRAVRADRGGSA
jgi:predicted ATP-dependent serine protease